MLIIVCNKFSILWVIKNLNNWYNKIDNIGNRRDLRAHYDSKVNYANTYSGQRILEYLGPTYYNSMN